MAAKIFSGPRQKRGSPILDLLRTGCRGHPCAPGQVFFFHYEPVIPINPAARKAPGRPLNSPATGTPEKAAGVPEPRLPHEGGNNCSGETNLPLCPVLFAPYAALPGRLAVRQERPKFFAGAESLALAIADTLSE